MSHDYSQGPGFRHESDTSREAAEKLSSAQRNRAIALQYIKDQGLTGATIDEVCVHLSKVLSRQVPPNAISGRFIELEQQEVISKTPQRRKTRSGRNAVVYIFGSWRERALPDNQQAPVMPKPVDNTAAAMASQVSTYRAKLSVVGHGHVVPRLDGRREGCGGTARCRQCRLESEYFYNIQQKEMNNATQSQ